MDQASFFCDLKYGDTLPFMLYLHLYFSHLLNVQKYCRQIYTSVDFQILVVLTSSDVQGDL